MIKKIAKHIVLIIIAVPIGFYLGQIIAMLFISLLEFLGIDDNFYNFLEYISI